MKLFASQGNTKNSFGNEKINSEFIKSFLNNSWNFIDLRIENGVVIEQSSAYRFNLENNEIICKKPEKKEEILNLFHAIALYHELILSTVLKDGYTENQKLYDLEGKLQDVHSPKITFKQIPIPKNEFYLDHPDRLSGRENARNTDYEEPEKQITIEQIIKSFNEGNTKLYSKDYKWVFDSQMSIQELRKDLEEYSKEHSIRTNIYKLNLESKKREFNKKNYEKSELKSFQDFNQGTDFFIMNNKCDSLETLIEIYQKSLQFKTATIISQLTGKFKPNKNLETIFESLNEEEILNLPCFRNEWFGYCSTEEPEFKINLSYKYEIEEKPEEPNLFQKKISPEEKQINIISELFSKEGETTEDYLNRIYRALEGNKQFRYFLYKIGIVSNETLKNTKLTKKLEYEVIEEITGIKEEDAKETILQYQNLKKINHLKKTEFINQEIINNLIEEGCNLSDIKWANPNLFEKLKHYQDKDQLKKWALNELKNDFETENPLIYSLLNLGFTKKELVQFLPKEHIRADAKDWWDTIQDLEGIEKHKYLCPLKKRLIQENKKISLENNIKLKEKIYFKREHIIENFKNHSYFLVPLHLFFFKTKQYQRFTQEANNYQIPLQIFEQGTLLYDTKKTILTANHIPEKFRNEFQINKTTDKNWFIHYIGPQYNANSKNKLFARVDFLNK